MRLKAGILFVVFICIQQLIYAQDDLYKFSRLDVTNGLSDNHVNCIFKDKQGFMWFGTTSGLNRYDGHRFKVFKHKTNDSTSVSENYILRINEGPEGKLWVLTHGGICVYDPATEKFSKSAATELVRYKVLNSQVTIIKKDTKGNFWFLTDNQGMYCYNANSNSTTFFSSEPTSKPILHSKDVMDIVVTDPNCVWLVYKDGVIDQMNTNTYEIVKRYTGVKENNHNQDEFFNLTLDNKKNLWVYTASGTMGAYCYNTQNGSLIHYSKDNPLYRLSSNVIYSVVQADDGKIWIGTDHGGIDVVDLKTGKIVYLLNSEDDPSSLSGNSALLYKDNEGIIWDGAFKQGISYYHKGAIQFRLTKHLITDSKSLPYQDINSFAEDTKGNLWIGANGGGLIYYNRLTGSYKQYKHDPLNANSLSNDIIISLCIDHENKLWIGTYFGGLDCFDGKRFVHYRHDNKKPGSVTDDRVYTILEDSYLNLWVGTFSGGLNVFDRKNQNFRHPTYPMISDYTGKLYQDRQGNIWIGRDKGIDVIEKNTGKVMHYSYQPQKQNTLAGNDVNTLMEDSRGLIWIGTKNGLSILNPKTNTFLNSKGTAVLPANTVSNILEDNRGVMWVSTTTGLVRIKVNSKAKEFNFQLDSYNELDGLQGREFNINAAIKLKSGELVFGGNNGFNLFNPESIGTFKVSPRLVFTDFRLFNKSVAPGDSIRGRVILNKSISQTQSIELNHDDEVFDITFADCQYFFSDKVKYQYILEAFDKDWITFPANSHTVTYTNLDAGSYVFKVRMQGTNHVISLNIKVYPPFWESPVAYLGYFLVAVGLLFYTRHRGMLNLKQQFEFKQAEIEAERKIAYEREKAERMHQLDLMKIKFFTNVSHEFRTPLSLILSPINDLLKTADKPEQQQQLAMIKRNGRRLLNLVNQLVDFRKMEYHELKLCLSQGNIIEFIKDVAGSFSDVAFQKQIEYHFESDTMNYITKFDSDKIERILFNLLSNAFKFTPAGGSISVILNMPGTEVTCDEKLLEIKVIDTGIGVSKENQERIFERFFQDDIPESLLNQGSGIGLSITKEFVRMHGGNIWLESEPDYGSCFIINLPVSSNVNFFEEVPQPDQPLKISPKTTLSNAGHGKKLTVLLIEDDHDLRFYLKENLKLDFHIIEADNGKDGWQKALALHPNLIVSDVNIPEMNGVDLCKKIKADKRTTHIPIILLTAMVGIEDQLVGLESGANDYIIKPFNFEILLSKVRNLLQMQQTLKKTFQKQVEVQSQDIVVISEDSKFLKKAFEYIETNMTDPKFSVEELSKHLALSRVSLYRKLLSLTGKTPIDCIRTIRLKRAIQLLEKSQLSIGSIAYAVGFSNAAYFARIFREEFGMLPSEYVIELRKSEPEDVFA